MMDLQKFLELKRPLIKDFELRALPEAVFQSLWDEHYPAVFGDKTRFDPRAVFSDAEKQNIDELRKLMGSPLCLRFGIYQGERFVGWHIGDQRSGEEFYMRNSGVLPELQGQGIYTALMKAVVGILKEVGFQVISSKHNATNNRVIIPKLKAGFVISGLEISDRFGTMVRLEFFTNPKRQAMMDFRCGQSLPAPEIRPFIGL